MKPPSNQKLMLRFRDRVGIVADISALIAKLGMNIVAMEVQRRHDEAHVYLEIENARDRGGRERLRASLERVADLKRIRAVANLPQEERENRIRVVLDNISDGVFAIDRDGRITTINRVACEALGCRSADVVGRPLQEIGLPDDALLDCLQGKTFSNIKQNFITPQGRFRYLATGRPIRDSERRIIGAVEIATDMQEIRKLASALSEPGRVTFSDIIGRTAHLNEAIAFAQKIAATDAVVSIRGESGTGKELFARAIHEASRRRGLFVPLNCAALPEHLLESELFGYEAGAFTGGQRRGKSGLFETARDGTIFLDEIAEMSQASQAKILRTIQEGTIRRIGGGEEIPINARIITATNQNLKMRVEEKQFRADLYYRINVLPIYIPPLRERLEDIPVLAEHFLFQLAARLDENLQILVPAAIDKLLRHEWPGNVRELKNVVERAAIISEGTRVGLKDIIFSHELEAGSRTIAPLALPEGLSLKDQMAEYERNLLQLALESHRSIRGTARALGISHPGLIKKIRKYQLKR
jgi:transcriptional regulator of aroF, aroG, tyrA and aromatic amino acid transport